MAELRALLAGGDRRSISRVPEVVATVLASPALLVELIVAMGDAVRDLALAHPGRHVALDEQRGLEGLATSLLPPLAQAGEVGAAGACGVRAFAVETVGVGLEIGVKLVHRLTLAPSASAAA